MRTLGVLGVIVAYCIVVFALLTLYWFFGVLFLLKYEPFRGEATRLIEMYLVPEVLSGIAAALVYNLAIQKIVRSDFGRGAAAIFLAVFSLGVPLFMLPVVLIGGCAVAHACF
jgi:hypothetical protein